MNTGHLFIALLAITCFAACNKKVVVKEPSISFTSATPQLNVGDSAVIEFTISDEDADLGNDTQGISGIYCKDTRYDSLGFVRFEFPAIDSALEDPNKGLEIHCEFVPIPYPTPRLDTLHTKYGDTLTYQIYVEDRAGHKSNIITTTQIIIFVP